MADLEADWLARLLEASIRSSGLSERELERRLGWKRGELSKALQNGTPLEHQQVLDLLEALHRADAASTAAENGGGMVSELLGRFQRLGYEPVEPAKPEPPFRPEPEAPSWESSDLERRVEEILAEAFGHRLEDRDPGEQ